MKYCVTLVTIGTWSSVMIRLYKIAILVSITTNQSLRYLGSSITDNQPLLIYYTLIKATNFIIIEAIACVNACAQ